MIVKHDIPSYSITWLANTYDKEQSKGVIENYFIPETKEEFISLCKTFYGKNEEFRIIGHTSNIYIRPNTSIKNVISTRKLTHWEENGNQVICDCGVSVQRLVASMIDKGIEGFAELIDLPGTVGAALYGNAGVGECLLSNVLVSVDILQKDGIVRTMARDDMNYKVRSSILKEGVLGGAILSATLSMRKGYIEEIKNRAREVHEWRLANQPGPSRNLGTTILVQSGKPTIYGITARVIAKMLFFICKGLTIKEKTDIILSLMGASSIKKYLCGLNRFIWKDYDSHIFFDKYVETVRRIYKNAKLEIEVW